MARSARRAEQPGKPGGRPARHGRGARGGRPGRRSRAVRRGAVRHEAAGTVAVVADEAGFALMRDRYSTFCFTGHTGYLREAEALLRSLAARYGHAALALFDPEAFGAFCAREQLEPDSSASRARYTAEVAARGATVAYAGEPIGRLLPVLRAEQEREETWERGTAVLTGTGSCPGCGAPLTHCAFGRAASVLAAVLERSAPGEHHLVCTVLAQGAPLTAALRVGLGEEQHSPARFAEPDALVLCTVLAAGLATGGPGGLVQRTVTTPSAGVSRKTGGPGEPRESAAGSREEVRGWSLHGGVLRPLGEAEVFAAYCTDAGNGEPLPPEPGVAYRAAPALPPGGCPAA